MDHSRAPVLEALAAFHERGDTTYGPPGHRQGRGVDPRVLAVMGEGVFASDVLMLNGLDDRRMSGGILEEAQELMAEAVRAEKAFFSTCGSSLSVKSAMLAVAGPGEQLLISRNAHKSVIAGVIINGTEPVWVHPKWDDKRKLSHPPEPDDVRRALDAHPDARGMLLITPTDWGTCADIAGAVEVCHAHGVPLIVDEAWGAHLPFHDGLPTWGMDAGADVVVTSVHKMGAAVEQSSVFHLQGDLVDPIRLKQREDLLGTLARARRIREAIEEIDGLDALGDEVVEEGLAKETDPMSIAIDVSSLGVTGYQMTERARSAYHVNFGASDSRRVSVRLTHADNDDSEHTLVEVLHKLVHDAEDMEPARTIDYPPAGALELETVMLPRDAFFGEVDEVPPEEAVGRVAAEIVSPYPPGVPVLAPGELINQDAVDYLLSSVAAGALLPDPASKELEKIRVVARG
ncbi:MAG: PLP-dependent transferase [Propionibacteriales bacterium]|nr:PLP-dependent transferase [Propionibacteriales bacterium]